MLTGRRLFAGETVSDVLAAVLTREPDWKTLPAATPAGVQRTLRRCLERDPRQRFRDAGDIRIELEGALGGASTDGLRRRRSRTRAAASGRQGRAPSFCWAGSPSASRLAIAHPKPTAESCVSTSQLPKGLAISDEVRGSIAISPDDRAIAFVARDKRRRESLRQMARSHRRAAYSRDRTTPGILSSLPTDGGSASSRRAASGRSLSPTGRRPS